MSGSGSLYCFTAQNSRTFYNFTTRDRITVLIKDFLKLYNTIYNQCLEVGLYIASQHKTVGLSIALQHKTESLSGSKTFYSVTTKDRIII